MEFDNALTRISEVTALLKVFKTKEEAVAYLMKETATISIAYIIFMWVKKDIVDIYATMPKEEVLPLVVTTVAVTVFKVVIFAAVILLVKWFIGKIKK